MKTKLSIGLSGGVLLLIVGLAWSCQKAETGPSIASKQLVGGSAKGSLRVYYDDGTIPGTEGVNYGCSGSGGNCLPDVVVTPGLSSDITNVFTAVYTGNQTSIETAFNTYQNSLLNYVSRDDIDGVIHGTYIARARGASPGMRYLIIYDSSGHIVSVYPLK